jgi:hypothetical protein
MGRRPRIVGAPAVGVWSTTASLAGKTVTGGRLDAKALNVHKG